jgi:metal-dependent amidase/aminoacylase/carboxypeptidase family protein
VYDTIKQKLQNLANGFEESFGAKITIKYTLEVPCLFNTSSIHEKLKPVLVDCFGAENIIQVKPLMGGEDFAFIANKIPSMFYFLGANNGTNKFFIHDPRVVFDENCIKYGSQFLARGAIRLLEEYN